MLFWPAMDAQTVGELTVGTRIAETFELCRLIGKGGMGTVWEAQHLRLPKKVAIKVLTTDAGADTIAFARFRREAEITSRLGHPNIVEIIDFNTLSGGSPYIVLELLSGESLFQRLQRGPIELEPAMRIGRQLASALMAAHREQVVHRDLKPGNIFLCPRDVDGAMSDHVKVLDFGISKIVGTATIKTSDSVVLGTPRYMAPEQLTAPDKIDGRADQFTLAAIVYEMLTGEPLFHGDLAGTIYQIAHGTVSLTPLKGRFPDRVVAALTRALERDPARRFPDIVAFMAECSGRSAETVEGRGMAVPAAQDKDRGGPKRERYSPSSIRPWVAIASVGILLAVGLGIWALMPAQPEVAAASPDPKPPPTVEKPGPPPDEPDHLPSAPKVDKPPVVVKPAAPLQPLPPEVVVIPGKPPPKPPVAGPKEPELPDVAADLALAEKALAAGDFPKATFYARHSLLAQPTSHAYAILSIVGCRQKDIGRARASFFKVTGSDRYRVVRSCRAAGVEMD
jgi:serine/threonine-protein kinase